MRVEFESMSLQTPDCYGDPYDMDSGVHSTRDDLEFGQNGERRTKPKPMKDKICLVCGDKALGYNFNAVSCESCKAFFRRNAFKEIRGRCEGQCEVTVESRSYCKKCRLAKCFTIGMKRELILNDQQRQQRRQKIQDNRLRRHGLPVIAAADYSMSGDEGGACASTSSPSDSNSPSTAVSTTPTTTTASSDSSSSNKPGITLKDEADPNMTHVLASSIDDSSLDGLSGIAKSTISEVMKAFQSSFDGPMERNPIATPSNADFLNMADTSIRRLVKMAKQLQVFRKFSQEDQIALLKGAVVEVLILRSAKMFDANAMGWSVNKEGAQHTVLADSFQSENKESFSFFEQYMRFAVALLQVTRKDNIVLMLMIVMAVLSPDRAGFKNTKSVEEAQERYADVLREYLNVRYPTDEPMFARVLQKLADIRVLNETHTRMLMHMKVEELEPLIVEIFDISS